jgi:hypothetical protein
MQALHTEVAGGIKVMSVTDKLARRALIFCQNNSIPDNATLHTVLTGMTPAQLSAVVIALIEGLVDVGSPGT